MKKRPTDDNLRRRVAKCKRLGKPYLRDGKWVACTLDDGTMGEYADWLENLGSAVRLMEEVVAAGKASHYNLSKRDSEYWATSDTFCENAATMCRACVLAYLAVMEAKR